MTLIRYAKPESDLFGKRFSDIMDEFFSDAVINRRDAFAPAMDVSETESHFEIDIYLPGMSKEDIRIDMENGLLSVSGERTLDREEKGRRYHKIENLHGRFQRTIKLPESADQDTIHAELRNGILRISISKYEQKVRKEIKIK
jgi:HSP20 family protein